MSAQQLKFSLGSDPEFFFRQEGGGEMVSAIPHIAGTKHEPVDLPHGGNVQRDNVAVEIGTDVVMADDKWGWIDSLSGALRGLHEVTPKGLELAVIPSACFPKDQLNNEEAQRFGCDPDFDAWNVAQNEPPMPMDDTFRSCGGHVHVGCMMNLGDEPFADTAFLNDFQGKLNSVKAMDVFHGVLFSILDCSPEAVARRELYGKAGCHRPTDYGIEYRSLSNMWMLSPYTARLVQLLTNDALLVVKDGGLDSLIKAIGPTSIQETINTGDADTATKIMEKHLWPLMGDEARFFFNRSLAKVKENDMNFAVEWANWANQRDAMFV